MVREPGVEAICSRAADHIARRQVSTATFLSIAAAHSLAHPRASIAECLRASAEALGCNIHAQNRRGGR